MVDWGEKNEIKGLHITMFDKRNEMGKRRGKRWVYFFYHVTWPFINYSCVLFRLYKSHNRLLFTHEEYLQLSHYRLKQACSQVFFIIFAHWNQSKSRRLFTCLNHHPQCGMSSNPHLWRSYHVRTCAGTTKKRTWIWVWQW